MVVTKEPKKKNISKEEISAKSIIYYMMNDYKYIKIYQTKLGYFKEANFRQMANEILYYMHDKSTMDFADFMSYVEVSPLKEEFLSVIKDVKDTDLKESTIMDYILNIKENRIKESIKECLIKSKDSGDMLEKENYANKVIHLKEELESIIEERSVKK